MALISQSDLEAKLGRSLTSEEVTYFGVLNPALQTLVEEQIGSSVESVSETTHYYDGGVQHLDINPCTDISSVKLVDDDYIVLDTYDTSDYAPYPKHKTVKTMIRHRSKFMTGLENIAVTAKFSIYADTNIRAVIKNALLEILASEINDSDNIKRESIEGYSVEYIQQEYKDAFSSIYAIFPEII